MPLGSTIIGLPLYDRFFFEIKSLFNSIQNSPENEKPFQNSAKFKLTRITMHQQQSFRETVHCLWGVITLHLYTWGETFRFYYKNLVL